MVIDDISDTINEWLFFYRLFSINFSQVYINLQKDVGIKKYHFLSSRKLFNTKSTKVSYS